MLKGQSLSLLIAIINWVSSLKTNEWLWFEAKNQYSPIKSQKMILNVMKGSMYFTLIISEITLTNVLGLQWSFSSKLYPYMHWAQT